MAYFEKTMWFICALFIMVGYNNCAQQESVNSSLSSKPDEAQSNGTPYGGKLRTGEYIPSSNQFCGDDFDEKITVDYDEDTGTETITLDVPCENRQVSLSDSDLAVTGDKDRLLYNTVGFAHQSTLRAQLKDSYKVACRTTEQDFGAEILIYGLGPIYYFEHIELSTELTLYSTLMDFTFQYASPTRHAFVGENDIFTLQETESGIGFGGSWTSTVVDSTPYSVMICDQLDGTPVDEWQ